MWSLLKILLNLIRNFYQLGVLKVASDINANTKDRVKKISKNIDFRQNYMEIINDENINAVVIATPAKSHYMIVDRALSKNKHVFVEKPLCLNLKHGKKLKAKSKQ